MYNLKTIMADAWSTVKATGVSIKVALKHAWARAKGLTPKQLLTAGLCLVRFQKKSGEWVDRLATRNLDSVPAEHQPKESNTNYTDTQIRFYDLTANNWRSFLTTNNYVIYPLY